jgi:hypothetical protein
MNEYKLTFTVTIKEQDDPAAREQAKEILNSMTAVVSGAEAKLQEIYTDRPPRGVRLNWDDRPPQAGPDRQANGNRC